MITIYFYFVIYRRIVFAIMVYFVFMLNFEGIFAKTKLRYKVESLRKMHYTNRILALRIVESLKLICATHL